MIENWIEPNPKNVEDACREFDGWKDNPDPALCALFEQFPCNTDERHVLLKVATLNATYSTQIRAISNETPTLYDVARHIVTLKIDEALEVGNVDLVENIACVETSDGRKMRNYSFATKYCNWQKHHLYPIYDSRVDEYLWQLRQRAPFADFHRQDLKYNYPKFKTIIDALRMYFGLDQFDYKRIDKFLFVAGMKLFNV